WQPLTKLRPTLRDSPAAKHHEQSMESAAASNTRQVFQPSRAGWSNQFRRRRPAAGISIRRQSPRPTAQSSQSQSRWPERSLIVPDLNALRRRLRNSAAAGSLIQSRLPARPSNRRNPAREPAALVPPPPPRRSPPGPALRVRPEALSRPSNR